MQNTQYIQLDALDTLFFKDGRPFSMGEETWANGLFPPSPHTLYGAIRTWMISAQPQYLSDIYQAKLNKTPLPETHALNQVRITHISYLIGNKVHYPLPLDFAQPKNRDEDEIREETQKHIYRALYPKGEQSITRDSLQFWPFEEEVGSFSDQFISLNDFEAWQAGKAEAYTLANTLSSTDYMIREPKIGIGRNRTTRTAQEGQLYRTGMIRPHSNKSERHSIKLILGIDNFPIVLNQEKHIIKLGGEGKTVQVKRYTKESVATPKLSHAITSFALYLSTPTVFEQGWLPKWINADPQSAKYLTGKFQRNGISASLKLQSAFIGKPQKLGGWDMINRRPKPMYRCVPAGSVYHFQIKDSQNIEGQRLKDLFKASISELNTHTQGFGIAYVGHSKLC